MRGCTRGRLGTARGPAGGAAFGQRAARQDSTSRRAPLPLSKPHPAYSRLSKAQQASGPRPQAPRMLLEIGLLRSTCSGSSQASACRVPLLRPATLAATCCSGQPASSVYSRPAPGAALAPTAWAEGSHIRHGLPDGGGSRLVPARMLQRRRRGPALAMLCSGACGVSGAVQQNACSRALAAACLGALGAEGSGRQEGQQCVAPSYSRASATQAGTHLGSSCRARHRAYSRTASCEEQPG